MAILRSKIDARDPSFAANAAHHRQLSADLRQLVETIARGGDERSRKRHTGRGKLLPRDRVRGLLDQGSPFLEIGQLGGHGLYDDDIPGGGSSRGSGASRAGSAWSSRTTRR